MASAISERTQMSTTTDQQIERTFAAAVAKEQDGCFQEAFDLYQKALGLTFEECKKTTDVNKKASLQRIIVTYMDVAETIKKKIEESSTPVSPKPIVMKKEDTGITDTLTSLFFGSGKPQQKLSSPRITETKKSVTSNNSSIISSVTTPKPDTFDYTPAGREIKTTTKKVITHQPTAHNNNNNNVKSAVPKQAGSSSSSISPKPATAKSSSTDPGDKLDEYEKQIQDEMLDKSPGK